jgi:Beta-lactamase
LFFYVSSLAIVLGGLTFLSSCNPNVQGVDELLDASKLATDISSRLKDKCVGYQFVIHHKGSVKSFASGGEARMAPDAAPRGMSNFDKLNVASVSKTVTGAALIHVLNAKGKTVDDLIWTYLPSHWTIPQSVKTLTFKNLLQHKSGFRTTYGSDYANLKKLVGEGTDADHSYIYCNANFALMRFLIAELNGSSITAVPANTTGAALTVIETLQATEYTNAYMNYCQTHVFDKVAGASDMACKPTDDSPALCYHFPKDNGSGTTFGDMTLTNGERGWHMNTFQMANFFSKLHYSEEILPKTLSDRMINESMAYDALGTTPKGVKYYWKNGNYPGSMNPGELNACIIGFGTDIQISILINSQHVGSDWYINEIIKAFDAWNK